MQAQVFADTVDTLNRAVSSLSSSFNTSIFEIAAVILATAIVLFLTLVLIPIQQCASTYSAALLKYFKRDKLAVGVVVFLILCLFFNISMFFVKPTRGLAFVSAALLFVAFAGIVLMTQRIIKMLDPAEYLFPRIKAACLKTLSRGIRHPRDLTPQEKLAELEQQTKNAMMGPERIDPKNPKWAVRPEIISDVLEKMGPLKTVALKLMAASDYEGFEKAVGNIRDICVRYFHERGDYGTPNDDFLFSIIEVFRDLLRTANRNPNVYYSRCMFAATRDIGLSTVRVAVRGSMSGYNNLTQAVSTLLKESSQASVILRDRDRAFDSVGNLGEVGAALAANSVDMTAAEIASELAIIAELCHKSGDTVTPVPLRRSLSEIFFLLLWNRKLHASANLAFDRMLQAYDTVIALAVPPGADLAHGNPLVRWDPILQNDRSLSALVYAALFSPNHDDAIMARNLDVVSSIVDFIRKHHDRSHNTGWAFTDLVYQIGLWLFAFIDQEIQLELTLLQKGTIPTKENRAKAKALLRDIIEYSVVTCFASLNGEKKNIPAMQNTLHVPLSLLYLSVHWNRIHELGLKDDIGSLLACLIQQLNALRVDLDWNAHESLAHFLDFLARNDWETQAGEIQDKTKGKVRGHRGVSVWPILNFIKRPIVTFDQTVFIQHDKQIFAPPETRQSAEGAGTSPQL